VHIAYNKAGRNRKGIIMAEPTDTTPGSGAAVVDASGLLNEFGFKSLDEMKNAFVSYKTDTPALREKLAANATALAELDKLKKEAADKDTQKMSESQKMQKVIDEAHKMVTDLQGSLQKERRTNLLHAEINKVTQQSGPEEAELFADYVSLKFATEEFSSAEELAPKFKKIVEKWNKLGQSQTPGRAVPEGREGQGAPSDGGSNKGFSTFADRFRSMRTPKKG
jgi:hypothetical protein